jgi:hypothetical protein
MSPEYAAALAAHSAAFAKFDSIRAAYRAQTIDDAEFLAARSEYEEATKVYDEAFAKEAA